MQRQYCSSAVKNVDHEALWPALMNVVCRDLERTRRIVQCLTATSTLRGSFRHLEVHSTLLLGSSEQRNVLCEFLSLHDIAKRFLLRTA